MQNDECPCRERRNSLQDKESWIWISFLKVCWYCLPKIISDNSLFSLKPLFSDEFKRICDSYGLLNRSAFGILSFSAIRRCVFGQMNFILVLISFFVTLVLFLHFYICLRSISAVVRINVYYQKLVTACWNYSLPKLARFMRHSVDSRNHGVDQRHAIVMAARKLGIRRPLFCTAALN